MMKLFYVLLILSLTYQLSYSLNNGLARTPPMGWMSWERFRCVIDCDADPVNCIQQSLYTTMADLLVSLGLSDLGYTQVNIDDCWMAESRDSEGRLQPNATRFPLGIPYLSDYMHNKSLKLGIYEDFGNLTCGGYPGSLGHLELDAETFAEWKVDMLKLDGCYVNTALMPIGYPLMGEDLNATGRPIIYSCSWPAYLTGPINTTDWSLIAKNCNLWRLYDDIQDSWDSLYSIIEFWATNQDVLAPVAGPGNWNDPDQLIIGDFSLSYEESKTQFAIWAIIAAPLLMSNDLRSISDEALSILMNKEIIAVNQDPLGIQGRQIWSENMLEVWARPLSNNETAVVFLNGRSDGIPYPIYTTFAAVGITSGKVLVRDLYLQDDLGVFETGFTAQYVNPHGVVMVKLTPQ